MANTFQLHHGTYGAFCRHKGAFKDGNWNTELLESIQSVLEIHWLSLRTWICTQRICLERAVGAAFEKNTGLLNGIDITPQTPFHGFCAAHRLYREFTAGAYCVGKLHG